MSVGKPEPSHPPPARAKGAGKAAGSHPLAGQGKLDAGERAWNKPLACAGGQSRQQGKLGTEKRHFTLWAESPKCIKSRPGKRSHAEQRHEASGLLDRYVQAGAV